MPPKEKKRIVLEVMMEKKVKATYYGRLLGIVRDDDFHVLITKKESQIKLFTAETLPLSEIGCNYDDFKGKRLVMTVKEIDGEVVAGKKFFITEKLDMISFYDKAAGNMCVECKDGNYVYIDEREEGANE